jgi:hypothetical protein
MIAWAIREYQSEFGERHDYEPPAPDRCKVRGRYVVLRSVTGHLASYQITLRLKLPREASEAT